MSRRCSGARISSSRTAISSCATAHQPLPLGPGAEGQPRIDKAINRRLGAYYERTYGVSHNMFAVPEAHILPRKDPFKEVACAK